MAVAAIPMTVWRGRNGAEDGEQPPAHAACAICPGLQPSPRRREDSEDAIVACGRCGNTVAFRPLSASVHSQRLTDVSRSDESEIRLVRLRFCPVSSSARVPAECSGCKAACVLVQLVAICGLSFVEIQLNVLRITPDSEVAVAYDIPHSRHPN